MPRKKSKPILTVEEFETIVEYSYHTKQQQFVIRFLDGSSYVLKINELPKKLQTKNPRWEDAVLSSAKNSILVTAGKDTKEIPSYVIHSRGSLL